MKEAIWHGQNFWSVYGPAGPAHLLEEVTVGGVIVRASPLPRTAQVAVAFLHVMGYPANQIFPIHVQPEVLDGIVSSYSCPYARHLRQAIESNDVWQRHLCNHSSIFSAVNEVLVTKSKDVAWNYGSIMPLTWSPCALATATLYPAIGTTNSVSTGRWLAKSYRWATRSTITPGIGRHSLMNTSATKQRFFSTNSSEI